MKFTTRGGIAVGAILLFALVHLAVKLLGTAQKGWPTSLVSVGLLVLGLVIVVAFHAVRHHLASRETLEIGRRGLLVTQPEAPPIAVSWRAIQSASLERTGCRQWRFVLKTGGEVFLREDAFSGEQWKKFSAELQRKLAAKKIPVRVEAN